VSPLLISLDASHDRRIRQCITDTGSDLEKILAGLGVLVLFGTAALMWVKMNKKKWMRAQIDKTVLELTDSQACPATRFDDVFYSTGSPQFNADRALPCAGVIAGGHPFLLGLQQGYRFAV